MSLIIALYPVLGADGWVGKSTADTSIAYHPHMVEVYNDKLPDTDKEFEYGRATMNITPLPTEISRAHLAIAVEKSADNAIRTFIRALGLNGITMKRGDATISLKKGDETVLQDGDIIYLLPARFPYSVQIHKIPAALIAETEPHDKTHTAGVKRPKNEDEPPIVMPLPGVAVSSPVAGQKRRRSEGSDSDALNQTDITAHQNIITMVKGVINIQHLLLLPLLGTSKEFAFEPAVSLDALCQALLSTCEQSAKVSSTSGYTHTLHTIIVITRDMVESGVTLRGIFEHATARLQSSGWVAASAPCSHSSGVSNGAAFHNITPKSITLSRTFTLRLHVVQSDAFEEAEELCWATPAGRRRLMDAMHCLSGKMLPDFSRKGPQSFSPDSTNTFAWGELLLVISANFRFKPTKWDRYAKAALVAAEDAIQGCLRKVVGVAGHVYIVQCDTRGLDPHSAVQGSQAANPKLHTMLSDKPNSTFSDRLGFTGLAQVVLEAAASKDSSQMIQNGHIALLDAVLSRIKAWDSHLLTLAKGDTSPILSPTASVSDGGTAGIASVQSHDNEVSFKAEPAVSALPASEAAADPRLTDGVDLLRGHAKHKRPRVEHAVASSQPVHQAASTSSPAKMSRAIPSDTPLPLSNAQAIAAASPPKEDAPHARRRLIVEDDEDTTTEAVMTASKDTTAGGMTILPHHGEPKWSTNNLASLRDYIRNPTAFPGAVLSYNASWCVVRDRYPKSLVHVLVVPRAGNPTLADVPSVSDLRKIHVPALKELFELALSSWKQQNDAWELLHSAAVRSKLAGPRIGFHAVPSIHPLHCHVMSTDMVSPFMKNKKHYLSFTTPEFFIPLQEVITMLEDPFAADSGLTISRDAAERALKGQLICHHCGLLCKTIPSLKNHLLECCGLSGVDVSANFTGADTGGSLDDV